MRVAILGMGAVGQHVSNVLAGRCELVRVDRTRSPLRDGEPTVDAAIVTTKTPGTPWAAEQAARILAPDGVALTIQNGLGNYETLAAALGAEGVAVGVIYVGAGWRKDGTHYVTGPGRIEAGRPSDRAAAARLEALAGLLRAGKVDVAIVDDPWPTVWRKLVLNAVLNPTSAILDATYGELLGDPGRALLCDAIARESARVATAVGYALGDDAAVADWRALTTAMPEHRSSMHADVAARRPTEIDAINGALVREAARHGLRAPANQALTVLVPALGG